MAPRAPRRTLARRLLRKAGTSAIEFGLCLPFAIILTTGIIDGTRLLNNHHTVARAVRDGARVGAMTLEDMPQDGSEITAAAETHTTLALTEAGVDPAAFTVSTAWVLDGGMRWITVEVDLDFTPIFPGMSPFEGPIVHEFWMITQEQ